MPEPDVAPPDLIADHEFEPWEYNDGPVVCRHWDPKRPTRRTCERPREEHTYVKDDDP